MRACAYLLPVDGVAREMPGSGFVSVIAATLVLPPLRLVTHAFPTLPQAKRSRRASTSTSIRTAPAHTPLARVPHKPRPLAPPFPRVLYAFKISYENSVIHRA